MSLALPGDDPLRACFGETTGCLLVEVSAAAAPAFEQQMDGLSCTFIGTVTSAATLVIACGPQTLIDLPVERLLRAWRPEGK